jgi:RND family efflux transporter MFP subunit
MFEMVRDGRLELRAQVAEADLARVKPGQSVSIVATEPGRPKITATVREVSPVVDQDSRLGMVRIDLPSAAGVRPGNFVKGEILVGLEDARVLPASAIVYKDNRALVYTVGVDNKTQMHFVAIGERTANGEYVEIISGLSPEDKVVAKGSGFLKDGDLVNVNLPSGAK